MFIIGITGPSGAGKTTALRSLEQLGALILDCDAVYHDLLTNSIEMKSELGSRFSGVLQNDSIDRRKLGEIVFNDQRSLSDLNAITHKYIGDEVAEKIAESEANGGKIAAIDAIALIESGIAESCNVTVGVIAPPDVRISRIMARDGLSHEKACLRINAQKPESFFMENCDIILDNVYNIPKEFEEKCKTTFTELIGGYLSNEH